MESTVWRLCDLSHNVIKKVEGRRRDTYVFAPSFSHFLLSKVRHISQDLNINFGDTS